MSRGQAMGTGAELCDWLAGIFAAPVPAEALAEWKQDATAAALREAGEAGGIGPEVASMLAALGGDAAGLETAHHRLFSGLAGPRTVAPYQSVQADPRGLLWGEPAAAMRDLLARHAMHPHGVLEHEAPDHIAVQLALLAELLRRGDRAGAAGLLEAHLLPWLPGFAAAVAAEDTQGFHAAAAQAAARLTAGIRAELGESLSDNSETTEEARR